MSKNTLIALSGKMHSGKSTVADIFLQDKNWSKVKFAQHIKDIVNNFLIISGYSDELAKDCVDGDLKNELLPNIGLTPRWMLQNIGSDFPIKNNYHYIWRDIAMQTSLNLINHGKNVIIDDLRFSQESDSVHKNNGYTIFVDRKHKNLLPTNNNLNSNLLDISNQNGIISNNKFIDNMMTSIGITIDNIQYDVEYRLPKYFEDDFFEFVKSTLVPYRFTDNQNDNKIKQHISENSLPSNFDYVLDNNGTLLDLKNNIQLILNNLSL